MNVNLKPIELANKLKEITGINVFENTRRRSVIEVRSLLCYLMRVKLKMRWISIANFFQDNGKHITHATVINAVNSYSTNKRYKTQYQYTRKLYELFIQEYKGKARQKYTECYHLLKLRTQ